MEENNIMAPTNSAAAMESTSFLLFMAHSITGSYCLLIQFTKRTDTFLEDSLDGFKNKEEATGT